MGAKHSLTTQIALNAKPLRASLPENERLLCAKIWRAICRAHGEEALCREPEENLTANKKAHGEPSLCRALPDRHMANLLFAVCCVNNTRQSGLYAVGW